MWPYQTPAVASLRVRSLEGKSVLWHIYSIYIAEGWIPTPRRSSVWRPQPCGQMSANTPAPSPEAPSQDDAQGCLAVLELEC